MPILRGGFSKLNLMFAKNTRALIMLHGLSTLLRRKTIYGRCPKCKTKSELEVISGNPGREKFRCNQCYHNFGMDEL